ncbi:MAG TPA: hypothetical protein VJ828_13325 [Lacipirellulaceae bacterium]|nr:hypothetical protein [Lacipirellulaceae bacterium]
MTVNLTLDLIDRLEEDVPGGYSRGGEPTTEPTALAGLALAAHGRIECARLAATWLANQQADDGSIGISPSRPTPCWPTGLAILLWRSIQSVTGSDAYGDSIDPAVRWALAQRGRTQKRGPYSDHDTTLVGWSWAANTHSWVEPSAMFVLALKAAGQGEHPRTREAVRLISDRLLPAGGCNYGNTIVLGQALLPHVQPTGLAMMALADEKYHVPQVELSLNFLQRELCEDTTTSSLCYGLLGLAAHDRMAAERFEWLQRACIRSISEGVGCYKLALLALAAAEKYPFSNDRLAVLAG